MEKATTKYPERVCQICGKKASKFFTISNWEEGKCDVCGREAAVTHPRDYGYPDFGDI